MIADTITKQIGEALKAHDEIRLSTLRMLSSALNYEFIAKQHKLSEDEEIVVVRREAKKRKDAIEIYEKVGEKERSEKEKRELEILKEYLPQEMGEEELNLLVEEVIKTMGVTTINDMGRVIGTVVSKSGGRTDGAKVAEIVRIKLTS